MIHNLTMKPSSFNKHGLTADMIALPTVIAALPISKGE